MRSGVSGKMFAFRLAVAVVLLLGPSAVRAEFEVGTRLPQFSLESGVDGSTFTFRPQDQQMALLQGDDRLTPKVLVVHLFQPDCLQCQAQMKALEQVSKDFGNKGVAVVGISHRGDAEDVKGVAKQQGVTYPMLAGKGSEIAGQFAAGDSLAIADSTGTVRFATVGYGQGEEKVWREAIEQLLAGKPVTSETVQRERLRAGDHLPSIHLPSVADGKPMSLSGEGGKLTFRDTAGNVKHPRGAIGFFSRY